MKKIILMLSVATTFSTISNAQSNNTAVMPQFGIKAGGNLSNVYDTKGQDFTAKAKVGGVLGVFATIPISKLLGIQPEVLFSQKGFKATGTLLGQPYSYTRTTDYLDIPILLAIKPTSTLTILAGPQYSYLLKEKNVFDNTLWSSSQEEVFDNDNVRKNTLCFLGGLDFNYDKMVIGTRVGWDLKTNNGDGTSSTPRYKNRWFQATLGYKF